MGYAPVVPLIDVVEPNCGMADIFLGVIAIIAGGVMLVAGQLVLRLMLPIWGFFAGFAFGAGLVAELAEEHFLGTALGWVLGLVFALIFAVLAYLYYAVAVIIAMAAIGFAIGSGLVVAIGINWNWLAVLIGLAVGAVVVCVDGREHADGRAATGSPVFSDGRTSRPEHLGGFAVVDVADDRRGTILGRPDRGRGRLAAGGAPLPASHPVER